MLQHQRNTLLLQLRKVASTTPFRHVIPALTRATLSDSPASKWEVMGPEDLRRFKEGEEDADILRTTWMFRSLPPRNLASGAFNCARNALVGTCCGIWLAINIFLTETLARGPIGLVKGAVVGPLWTGVFFFAAFYAAGQQLAVGMKNQLLRPCIYCCATMRWHDLDGAFKPYTLGRDPQLELAPPNEYLFRRAMKRHQQRQASRRADVAGGESSAGQSRSLRDDASLYSVLGVKEDATEKEIKSAYAKLAMQLHPDRNPSKEAQTEFDRVTKAYRVLSNREKRKKYDAGGEQALEGTGQKKRDGLRGLFGGDALCGIVGEVRAGSFSRRFVDEIDFDRDEIVIVQMRNRRECAEELLSEYLAGYQAHSKDNNKRWAADVRKKINKFVTTGLAKEVMFVVANEYQNTIRYIETPPLERAAVFASVIAPQKGWRRLKQAQLLMRLRPAHFRDDVFLMDLIWHMSETELVANAKDISLTIVSDASVGEDERYRRKEALKAFAAMLLERGSPYKGASKAVLHQLQQSMKEYQVAKAKAKAEEQKRQATG